MPRYGPLIEAFERGARVEQVPVVVVEATGALTKTDKPFGRYVLRDRSGSLPGIFFDHTVASAEAGAVALVAGTVDEYRGSPQLKLSDLLVVERPTPELLERLAAAIDGSLEQRLLEILQRTRESLPESFWWIFCDSLGHDPFDTSGAFWHYAAAQSKHHCERGGLAWHVLTMVSHVDAIAPAYPKLDTAILKLAVLTHDLGKFDCYEMGAAGCRQLPLDRTVGHTSYSIFRVCRAIERAREAGYPVAREDEEAVLHCIAGHHGRREWGAVSEPTTPEASALHALDLLDSQLRPVDARNGELPDRGAAARVPIAAMAGLAEETEADDDPFLVDDDDPFDEPAGGRHAQGSLF